jgi:hypothetical protein
MAEIEIHFTEYFDGETVVISCANRALSRVEHIKTDLRTGLAKIARVPVSPGRATLEFAVVASNVRASATVDTAHLKYVTVALAEGSLKVAAVSQDDHKREPRGYA